LSLGNSARTRRTARICSSASADEKSALIDGELAEIDAAFHLPKVQFDRA